MKTRNLLTAAACASILGMGTLATLPPAQAQRDAPPAAQTRQSPARQLSIREVYDLLEKQGYQNFTEIELKDRGREYEVKADNASRQYVKLYVDAYTGRILSERRKRY